MTPFDPYCGRRPEEIPEYAEAEAVVDGTYLSPSDYVICQEGTFNPANGHFCCTECYVQIGMPSSPQGWRAP